MIRNEFRAHYEDITCITVLEEPLCFITASKDKYVKIYNFNCDCLGIINSLPKLTKIDLPKVEWTFKINEEKNYKKKFKPIIKEEDEKVKRKHNFNDEQMNISYEEFYVQEAQKSI